MSHHRAPRRRPALVDRFGWRLYALPVLLAVTIVALVHGASSGHPAAARHLARPTHATATQPAPAAAGGVEGRQLAGADQFQAGADPAPVVVTGMSDSRSCAGNEYKQLVIVSIHAQHAWMCETSRQVYSTAVTTGATVDHDQTPTGSWRVQAKQRDRYLVGPGYKDYVQYWVPFNGDFGFHDASWQTMPFGSPDYTTKGSHGCVHLPTPVMRWFYSWAHVETTVVTVEA